MLGSQIFKESVSAVTLTPDVAIGTVREEGNNKYVYCYNAGGAYIYPGYGVTMSGTTGYSVTVSTVTETGSFFGICKHATMATLTYGWIIVRGFTTLQASAASLEPGVKVAICLDGLFKVYTISSTMHPLPINLVATCTAGSNGGWAYVNAM
jgi:hypothetical protein